MPYKAISEIASCSDPRDTAITPAIVTVWWAAFIAGNFVRVLGSSLVHAIGVSAYIVMEIVATAILTGAAVALFRVMLTIHRGQEQIHASSPPR